MPADGKDRNLRVRVQTAVSDAGILVITPKHGIKNSQTTLWGTKFTDDALAGGKNSSPTLTGDFGVGVACAWEHHFFLDITF